MPFVKLQPEKRKTPSSARRRDQRHNHDGKIGIRNPLIRAELTITVNTD
jgi:hypothetical protein